MTEPSVRDLGMDTSPPHLVTMAFLGDTFAIHEVGERLARTEVLPQFASPGEGSARKRMTLLVSYAEFAERYGFAVRDMRENDSLVVLAPVVESALETLREVLSGEEFGWNGCRFDVGLLERPTPASESELRILISPRGGIFSTGGNVPRLAQGTHHAVSAALAPEACPISDEEAAPILIERSRSRDLLATLGLVAFLRRNPEVARSLSEDTIRQIAFEFPRAVDAGLLAP